MYRIELFSIPLNSWTLHSTHKNLEYAEINYEVAGRNGGGIRMVYQGEIIQQDSGKELS